MDQNQSRKRRTYAKPLADMIGAALSPALAAKGFAGREVIGNWPSIVGERLGSRSRPLKIDWPRKQGLAGDPTEPATLVVLVESAFAPELQHAAPVLMARINAHLGWPAVGKVVLKQGPVQLETRLTNVPDKPLPLRTVSNVTNAAERITEPALKEAMTRLGLAISRRAARGEGTASGENV